MCEQSCIATSKDNYYTEMCNTLTDYNDCNNTPLSCANIREEIRKVVEEESITDANKVTAGTFSHASSAQRENANTLFTSDELDKLVELVESVKNLTINYAEY